MKRWMVLLIALYLAGCTPKATSPAASPASPTAAKPTLLPSQAAYPDLGPAPELVGDVWLNSESPQRLAGLRGKVVLVDMWTFG